MKTLLTRISLILLVALAACSEEEAINKASSPLNSDIMIQLDQTQWKLHAGPPNPYLIINGFNETEYLDYLSFSATQVYMRHKGANYIMPHHICYTNGKLLTVSIQECANTTWRPLFEWDIVSLDGNIMTMDVMAPELSPNYRERFTFKRL